MNKGWIGFDLDGTLAQYGGWKGPGFVGEPIWPMIAIARQVMNEGYENKIFTARACSKNPDREMEISAIKNWCLNFLGMTPEVTAEKDYEMLALFDDRALSVEFNSGRVLVDFSHFQRILGGH
jgi:hypothetical protein